jgi:hypothetical protein
MPDNSGAQSTVLDKTAVALSGLCLVHCLALPLVLAFLPFLNVLAEDQLHAQMLLIAVPVSTVAFTIGFRRHRRLIIAAFGALGLSLLIAGGTVAHSRYGLTADRTLTVAGSLVLALTHFWNSRLSRHRAAWRAPGPSRAAGRRA